MTRPRRVSSKNDSRSDSPRSAALVVDFFLPRTPFNPLLSRLEQLVEAAASPSKTPPRPLRKEPIRCTRG